MAFQAVLDQHGPNPRLEEGDLVGIVGITGACEKADGAKHGKEPLFHRGTNSKDAEQLSAMWREIAGGQAYACIVIFHICKRLASVICVLNRRISGVPRRVS